ncbi:flagellar hook-basal body complex protein FliE [Falsiroseomonas selenitidurans]|uniref:Flagellar hook-basal body complex protein FliE n=1 Tax=Falsiroseomonas selenitidurans TaxID=2716335 RepID=A0ABX1EBD1_9PROT|nr:flagellar hook-basal body complex protein FliE [Falsiroseomonas selenitidurans]NKC34532.1 flagellar hook-basal body complex protein FliE [Falsiroseomonas selenitidurans]
MSGGISPALQAYRATAGGAPGASASGATAQAFDSALGAAMESAVGTARAADGATQQAMLGQVGTSEVVMAVTRAELALQTAVAVRDRMVSAYQEVMRMAI